MVCETDTINRLVTKLIESKDVHEFKLEIWNYVGTKTVYRKEVEATDLP